MIRRQTKLQRSVSCSRTAFSLAAYAALIGARLFPGIALVMTLAAYQPARAQAMSMVAISTPGQECRAAVAAAERHSDIPPRLLAAISRVESGKPDPATGQVTPWPWSVNANGQTYVYATKAQAIAAVDTMQAHGIRSIDVGCGQINLMYHPNAFLNLALAFDPVANANYAARFLRQLFDRTRDWKKAAAMYHSATPDLGRPYLQKVLSVWPEAKRVPGPMMPTPLESLAKAWQSTLSEPPTDFTWTTRMPPAGPVASPKLPTVILTAVRPHVIRNLNQDQIRVKQQARLKARFS